MAEHSRLALITTIIATLGSITVASITFCTKIIPDGALGKVELVKGADRPDAAPSSPSSTPASRTAPASRAARQAEPRDTTREPPIVQQAAAQEPGPSPVGTWASAFTRLVITKAAGDAVTVQESLNGVVMVTGNGTYTNGQLDLQVVFPNYGQGVARLTLSADGQGLSGQITNQLGVVTPLQYRRVE